MHKFLAYLRNKHDYIFKIFLFLVTSVLIVWLFPKEAKFKYEFQKGKPWLHTDLIAPFNFSIQKLVVDIAKEQELIKNKSKLYFRTDQTIETSQIEKFSQLFSEKWFDSKYGKREKRLRVDSSNQKNRHFELGIEIIQSIYNKGIIKIDDVIENRSADYTIVVLNKNVGVDKELAEIYTLQTAYNFVKQSLVNRSNIDVEFLTEIIENALYHNIFYDEEISKKILNDQLQSLSTSRGIVLSDEKIISKGEVVNEDNYQKIVSLKSEYEKHHQKISSNILITVGQLILVSILMGALGVYLFTFQKKLFSENKKVVFILLMVLSFVFISKIPLLNSNLSIYIIPFCILPIVIRTFYNVRLALFTHIITTLLIGFLVPNSFEFILLQFISGIVSVYGFINLRKRAQIFFISFYLFISYSLTYFGIAFMQEGDSANFDTLIWFAGNSVLTLFAYPLIYVFEKLFGFVSDVSLIELSDTNNPLLKELAEKAPGTFQHSLQVANLAEELVRQIGGNALLVRTGALYHDIGKLYNPVFFIENQQNYNPHSEISHLESAKIIIEHVIKGVELAKKHNLPEEIIDFIRTHHGTSMTRYFYNSYKLENPDLEINEFLFRYPGPIPFSKEAAVLMMVDAVEAASRSLKKHNQSTINNLVDTIIENQANEGQFINSNITYNDITEAKKLLKKKLQSIYHLRIEYPKDSEPRSNK